MTVFNDSDLLLFYEECSKQGFTDLDDEYQNHKIQLIARNRGLTQASQTIDHDTFEKAKELFTENTLKSLNEKTKQLENELVKKHNELIEKNTIFFRMGGKEKRLYEIKQRADELEQAIKDIDKLKSVLVDSYYSGSKQEHESWFWQGLGAELATGSRVASGLVVGAVNEKNRQIDAQNQQLRVEIEKEINSSPQLDTKKQRAEVRTLRAQYDEYKMAYSSSSKNQFMCVGYSNLDWNYLDADKSITVTAEVWLKKKPQLPNNIDSSIDGVCQAVIYRKSDNKIIETVLIPLPFMGVGNSAPATICGVKQHIQNVTNEDNKNDYGVILIDFNTSAIEEKKATVNTSRKSENDEDLQSVILFESLHNRCNENSIQSISDTIVQVNAIDNKTVDGKEEYIQYLKKRLLDLAESEMGSDKTESIERAIAALKTVYGPEYRDDVKHVVDELNYRIDFLKSEKDRKIIEEQVRRKEKEENERTLLSKRKKKRKLILVAGAVLAIMAFVFQKVYTTVIMPNSVYEKAIGLMEEGEYREAIDLFNTVENVKDSRQKAIEAKYLLASDAYSHKDYETAYSLFAELGDYNDSKSKYYESKSDYYRSQFTNQLSGANYREAVDIINQIASSELPGQYKKIDDEIVDLSERIYIAGQYYLFADYYHLITNNELKSNKYIMMLRALGLLSKDPNAAERAILSFPYATADEMKSFFPGEWIEYRLSSEEGCKEVFESKGTLNGATNRCYAGSTVTQKKWYLNGNCIYINNPSVNGAPYYYHSVKIIDNDHIAVSRFDQSPSDSWETFIILSKDKLTEKKVYEDLKW